MVCTYFWISTFFPFQSCCMRRLFCPRKNLHSHSLYICVKFKKQLKATGNRNVSDLNSSRVHRLQLFPQLSCAEVTPEVTDCFTFSRLPRAHQENKEPADQEETRETRSVWKLSVFLSPQTLELYTHTPLLQEAQYALLNVRALGLWGGRQRGAGGAGGERYTCYSMQLCRMAAFQRAARSNWSCVVPIRRCGLGCLTDVGLSESHNVKICCSPRPHTQKSASSRSPGFDHPLMWSSLFLVAVLFFGESSTGRI